MGHLHSSKLFAVVLLLVLAFTSGCACFCPENKELQSRIDNLQTRVNSLEAREPVVETVEGEGYYNPILIERSGPDQVAAGQEYQYRIRVKNRSSETLSAVEVQEQLPQGLTFVSADPSPTSSARPLKWRMSKLEGGETETIVVTARATETGSFRSCATSSYQMPVCAPVTVVEPMLKLSKSGPSEVLQCETIPYQFKVTNPGTGVAENVVIRETLPEGLVTEDGSRQVEINVGDLQPDETRTETINVKAQNTGSYDNTATAVAAGDLQTDSNKITTVVRKPNLKLAKSGPERLFLGNQATYTIEVQNTGDGEARDTVVKDRIPNGMELVRASDGGSVSGRVVTWELGTMQPNASETLEVVLKATEKGQVANEVNAMAFCSPDASASAPIAIEGIAAILLETVDLTDPVRVGTNTTYVITATNQGSSDARQVQIEITMEDAMEYVSSSGPTSAQVEGNKITFAPLDSLAPNEEAEWRVVIKAAKADDVRLSTSMTTADRERPVQETEATNFYE